MKKIFMLLLTFIFVIPSLVRAEIIDLELLEQKGLKVGTDGDLGTFDIYRVGDQYFGTYNCNIRDGYRNYFYFTQSGITQYVESFATRDKVFYAGDKMFFIELFSSRSSNNFINTIIINELDINTNEVIKDYSWGYTTGYDSIDNIYYNEHGLVLDTYYGGIFVVNQQLEYHQSGDESYLYNNFEDPNHNDRLNSDEHNKFIEYLKSKLSITNSDILLDYAVEYQNNYFTIIKNEGEILSIIYTNKNLKEDIKNSTINTPEFNGLYIGDVELFAEEEDLNLFVHVASQSCPRSNEIDISPDSCGNGDIVMQKYIPIFSIDKKTDGNGTVEVIEQSKSGEKVTYKVNPKPGYKIEKIIITDAKGNKIEIKNNEFTMPSSHVLIEASFIVDNPNTSSNIYLGMAIIILVVGAFIIKKNKAKIDFIDK